MKRLDDDLIGSADLLIAAGEVLRDRISSTEDDEEAALGLPRGDRELLTNENVGRVDPAAGTVVPFMSYYFASAAGRFGSELTRPSASAKLGT